MNDNVLDGWSKRGMFADSSQAASANVDGVFCFSCGRARDGHVAQIMSTTIFALSRLYIGLSYHRCPLPYRPRVIVAIIKRGDMALEHELL